MSDINNLITDNIGLWASAIKKRNSQGRGSSKKIELAGVKKLRELILELAVRGKLVAQNVNDEPASVLLEKIAEEKAKLIADKKIKNQKSLPVMTSEEKALLPIGWSNAYMQDITKIVTCGMASTPRYHDEGRIFLSAKNVKPYKFMPADHKFVDEETYRKITQNAKPEKDDILLTRVGAGIGEAAVIDIDIEFAIYVSLTLIKPFHNHLYSYFLLLWLNSPQGTKKSIDNIYGRGVSAGNLNVNLVRGFVVPIPPLAEQHRIVAKVDELMALCDELEQQTEQSLSAHQTLVEVLLGSLFLSTESTAEGSTLIQGTSEASENAEDFQTSWQRIAEHFDVLFTTEHSIEQLKQTILQLAVMGKLVPQNPSDEPASILLEKIAEEKAQLIADKKIKKQKPLPAITDEEKQFELPNGWGLTRLDDICFGITSGSTPPKDKFNEQTGVPYLKVYNIKEQAIAFDYRSQFVDVEHHKQKLTRSILYPGDVVMNIVGPPLGKIAIIPNDYPEWNCNQAIVFFRPIEKTLNNYIYTYLTSGRFLDAIELIGTAGQDNISVTKSRSIIFPMPPIEEQHRIVAKVNELMVLCEQLKARLADTQTTQLHLADAVVENALAK